jgi:energy-coupling factor transporter transmembrane protein EcfT
VFLAASISHVSVLLTGTLVVMALLLPRRRQVMRLLWRSRWLLLIMFAGYGWTLPGQPLGATLAFWMPSREGLILGATQSLRLAGMLAALDLLLLSLPANLLLDGLQVWLRALARILPSSLRPDPERIALRLWLTLQQIEKGLPPLRGGGFVAAIEQAERSSATATTVTLTCTPLRWLDGVVMLGLFSGGMAWMALA